MKTPEVLTTFGKAEPSETSASPEVNEIVVRRMARLLLEIARNRDGREGRG